MSMNNNNSRFILKIQSTASVIDKCLSEPKWFSFKILMYMSTRALGVCICWSLDAVAKSDLKDLITLEDLLLLRKNSPRNGIVIEKKKNVCCSYSVCHILHLNSSVVRLVCNYSVFKFNKDSHYRKNREVEIMECREALR